MVAYPLRLAAWAMANAPDPVKYALYHGTRTATRYPKSTATALAVGDVATRHADAARTRGGTGGMVDTRRSKFSARPLIKKAAKYVRLPGTTKRGNPPGDYSVPMKKRRGRFGYAPQYGSAKKIKLATTKPAKLPLTTVRITNEYVYNPAAGHTKGVAWFGFSHHTQSDVEKLMGRAFLQRILIRAGSTVVRGEAVPDAFENTSSSATTHYVISKITFHFRRQAVQVGGTGALENVTKTQDITINSGNTFDTVADAIGSMLRARGREGWVPTAYVVWRHPAVSGGPEEYWFKQEGIDRAKIDFTCKCAIKMQNQTAASGSTDAMDIRANPIVGRVYDFDTPTPRFRRAYVDDIVAAGEAVHKMNNFSSSTGLLETDRVYSVSTPNNPVGIWKQPFARTRSVFERLKGTEYCSMGPGEFATANRVYTNNGQLSKFITGLYGSVELHDLNSPDGTMQYGLPKTGTCTLFGFGHKIREQDLVDETVITVVANVRRSYQMDMTFPKTPGLTTKNLAV